MRKYIHGACVDEVVYMIDVAGGSAVYYYHYDSLGSVVALSNSSGNSCQSYAYSAYGRVWAEYPEFKANPYLFTGRRFDYETGLYYYRARYYNPYIGRFLQTDPIGYSAGMNLYTYCGNNSLNYVDPSGLYEISISIPLITVWQNPSSDAYLEAHPEHSHKADVKAYLLDSGFYDLYRNVTLKSVEYSNSSYECVFDVPDDSDISMNIVGINGKPVFNVINSEGKNTPMIDQRLYNMIGPISPDAEFMVIQRGKRSRRRIGPWGWPSAVASPVSAIGFGVYLKTTALSIWHPIGWGMAVGGAVVVAGDSIYGIYDAYRNTSSVPNLAEIENAIENAIERADLEVDPYI